MNKIASHSLGFGYCFLTTIALALSACGSSEPPKPAEPTELRTSDAPTIDTPEAQLFHEAKRLYRAGLYSVAIDSFESLRVNYPLSPYVEFAEIKIADAKFETRDFAPASVAYEEFVKNHPASSITPYALLQAGRSFQMTNRGVGRDVSSLEKARDFYTRLIQQFPSSFYTAQARGYLKEVTEGIAENEKFVMDYYRRKDKLVAVEARNKMYEEKIRPEVLKVEAEAAQAPLSPIVRTAAKPQNPTVITARRAPSKTNAQNTESMRAALAPDTQPVDVTSLDIQRVQCRAGKVFVYLRQPANLEMTELKPQAGKVNLNLQGLTARPVTQDCLGKSDLSVSSTGSLTLSSDKTWDVMTVDNPPRVVLVER